MCLKFKYSNRCSKFNWTQLSWILYAFFLISNFAFREMNNYKIFFQFWNILRWGKMENIKLEKFSVENFSRKKYFNYTKNFVQREGQWRLRIWSQTDNQQNLLVSSLLVFRFLASISDFCTISIFIRKSILNFIIQIE